jgi:hypothetical protein
MGLVRDYRHIHEIHMEPGDLHEPYSPAPLPYPSELESALARVARQDCSRLKGTEFDIVTRRLERDGDMRYPLAADDRKVGIGGTTPMTEP